MLTRKSLISALQAYRSSYPEESSFIPQFLELLKHPRAFHRDHLPGHVTGSAWIIDDSTQYTLLTHHAKLNRWLQPGGHADGDENIINVAMREAREETGLTSLQLLSTTIFDIDIHTIPARNDFPEHLHYDIRILLMVSRSETFTVTDESHNLSWIRLEDVTEKSGNNRSMIRMAKKVFMLF